MPSSINSIKPTDEQKRKMARQRSPAYPAINLETAIKRARTFWDYEKRNSANLAVAMEHWGFKPKSSGGMVTFAALKYFGLMKDSGGGLHRTVQLTDLGYRIVVDQRPVSTERDEAIKQAALAPKIHALLWKKYQTDLPSDANLRHELIFDQKFNEKIVDDFIQEYRGTIRFAKLVQSDNISSGNEDNGDGEADEERQQINIGDHVQWESQGVLQFSAPRRVRALSEDGEWAFVEGSETGVPVKELTVEQQQQQAQEPKKPPTLPLQSGAGRTPVGSDIPVAHDCIMGVNASGRVTQSGIEKLIAYLQLIKGSFPQNGEA